MHHPLPAWPDYNSTFALYGTSLVNLSSNILLANLASKVGGSLNETLTLVSLLTTFPAFEIGGNPSAPVIDKLAFHTLFK